MLIRSKELKGYKLGATDGEIGRVKDFYFDDTYWTVRYLVADTARWMAGRQVLISPYALDSIDEFDHSILLNIDKDKIEASPSIESDEPVSKQFENSYYGYYGWPTYWFGYYPWGASPYLLSSDDDRAKLREDKWDPQLRSTKEVVGYQVDAVNGEVGKVEDFIIDDETWTIRYLIVKTGNWFTGKEVLVSSEWIESIDWNESKVLTSLSREAISSSPEYNEDEILERTYEAKLHEHYGFKTYWDSRVPDLRARHLKRSHETGEPRQF